MFRSAILTIVILQLIASQAVSSPICRHFYVGTYRIQDAVVSWYMPIDFGDNQMIRGFHEKQDVLHALIPQQYHYRHHSELGDSRAINFQEMGFSAKFMPGMAFRGGSHYFAVETSVPDHFLPHLSLLKDPEVMANFRIGKSIATRRLNIFKEPKKGPLLSTYMLELHDSSKLSEVEALVSYDLTWKTYLAEGTVQQNDIRSFTETEKELDPRRKITFEVWIPEIKNGKMSKKTLGIMRVYDGSKFPTMTFGDFPTHHETINTDPRVPVERRYPEINFREDTDFIFEPGRLAKSPEAEGSMIEYQFHSLAEYLQKKFGFRGLAPADYVKKGKVLAEITGRNLEKFMKARADGGFGYTLDYIVETTATGRKITKVKKGTTYQDLKHRFEETGTKFLLHQRVGKFAENYL